VTFVWRGSADFWMSDLNTFKDGTLSCYALLDDFA